MSRRKPRTKNSDLRVLLELTEGLTVKFDRPLEPHARRLMKTLGVTVIEPEPRPTGSSAPASKRDVL